ncbi:MAG: ABC transporter ATP-binding protein [Candidatus Moranbacteria bacterium]|nr:ABC transporter ATP-binding protein [Candidatus Moranbacteria bacterium]
MIEIKDLNVIYNKGKSSQVRALENVNLKFQPKEWIIVFGPSGCGKSTLLNSIAGLETPTSGEVHVLGADINKLDSNQKAEYRRNTVGMVFQSFHLINSLKVLENICLPQVFFGANLQSRKKIAKSFLDRFGIADQAKKYPSDISGGQKQKVSIARALMNKPEIILADEPMGNLDSKSTYNVMAILKDLNKVDKKTIIMVTHDHHHLKYADRIVHIKDGKVLRVEVIKKRRDVGNDGKRGGRMILAKEVEVPMDLKLLMNSFRDLTNPNVGQLLAPFKVKQTFSYLMLPLTNHQVELTQKSMRRFFLEGLSKKQFFEELNQSVEKGGAGWDKRGAEKFVKEVIAFYDQAQKIDYSESLKSARRLVNFFIERYPIRKTEYRLNILRNGIENRLKNELSRDEFQEILDKPSSKEGLGLNKKTAQKIARELELTILIRYSS